VCLSRGSGTLPHSHGRSRSVMIGCFAEAEAEASRVDRVELEERP